MQTDIPTTAEGMKAKLFNMGTIVILIAGILVLVGFGMDWITAGGHGEGGSWFADHDYPEAWLVLVMGILIIIMPFIKFPIGSTIMGIIAMIIPIEVYLRFTAEYSESGIGFGFGIGAILVVVGGFMAIFGGPIAHKLSKIIPLPPQ